MELNRVGYWTFINVWRDISNYFDNYSELSQNYDKEDKKRRKNIYYSFSLYLWTFTALNIWLYLENHCEKNLVVCTTS